LTVDTIVGYRPSTDGNRPQIASIDRTNRPKSPRFAGPSSPGSTLAVDAVDVFLSLGA
jgi:hypothetical protein